jgi:outer membrane protein assembly factor BamD (BamD/ComL family)
VSEAPALVAADCPYSHLENVSGFIGRGDFESAFRESQAILARSPKTAPGDEALMTMGLLAVHYANPKKDYKKAMGYFKRMEQDFPQSPLVAEARIWAGVLRDFEKAKQVDLEIEHMKKGMGKR